MSTEPAKEEKKAIKVAPKATKDDAPEKKAKEEKKVIQKAPAAQATKDGAPEKKAKEEKKVVKNLPAARSEEHDPKQEAKDAKEKKEKRDKKKKDAKKAPAARLFEDEPEEKKERRPMAKAGKLIIRNLGFDLKDKHLTAAFKKFGSILDVSVPLNASSNTNRGFAFVEFNSREDAADAITEMNGTKYKGRNLTVEFSVPKNTYEARIDNIVANTNMERKDAITPFGVKSDARDEEDAKKKEIETKAATEAAKTVTQRRKEKRERQAKEKEEEAKKLKSGKTEQVKGVRRVETQNDADCTLFVRNIGWDTDQQGFREFMESFGEIRYAVLCKSRGDLLETVEGGDEVAQKAHHKGTGFVRFVNLEDADALTDLSKKLEEDLDTQHREKEKHCKKSASAFIKPVSSTLLGSSSLLKGELELNGRRLVIMPSVARTRVEEVVKANKDRDKGTGMDRRNLGLKKEGLLNEASWVHQDPAPTAKDLDQRRKLFMEKDNALKKSPNLSVSPMRLQLRNLPKREFHDPELRELMVAVVQAYRDAGHGAAIKGRATKHIKQVKVLKDVDKTYVDPETQLATNFSSGLAFVQLQDPELSLFAVRYLNNMQLAGKPLVVDFALDDARKTQKRAFKLEKHQRLAMEKKEADKKEARLSKRAKTREEETGVTQQGGIEIETEANKRKVISVASCEDLATLQEMLEQPLARGKKQRIKKKIQQLKNPDGIDADGNSTKKKKKEEVDTTKLDAKSRVEQLLRKRDEKLQRKEDKKKAFQSEEDKEIVKVQKQKKREKRRETAKDEDDFDEIFNKYKTSIIKKLDKEDADQIVVTSKKDKKEKKEKKDGKKKEKQSERKERIAKRSKEEVHDFEEVVMSD